MQNIQAPPVPVINYGYPLAQGLQHAWPCQEGSGLIAHDIGPNGDTPATFQGTTAWIGDSSGGYGLDFLSSGNNDLDLSGATILTAGKPFSVAWWEYAYASVGTFGRLYLETVGSNAWTIVRSSSFRVGWSGLGTTSGVAANGAPTLASLLNTWAFFCVTGTQPDSNTAANFACYVNGISYTTASTTVTGGTNVRTRFGYDAANAPKCRMSRICIWNRVLTQDEVNLLYAFPDVLWMPKRRWLKKVSGKKGKAAKKQRVFLFP